MRIRAIIVLLVSLCFADTSLAQEQSDEGGADLAQQARNPTASLTMFQIMANYTPGFHNLDSASVVSFVAQPVIPFKTGKIRHVGRITLAYVASSPNWGLAMVDSTALLPPNYVPTADVNGLGDMAIFDFMVFPAPWKGGQVAAGISATVPTATDPALGTEKWTVGPAVAALVQAGKFLGGALVLSNFSVAGASDRDDVNTLSVQPFGSYGLADGWSVELPNMMFNYNFDTNEWGSLPLGLRLAKLASIGKLPVRFFADAEYNFADKAVAPEWTFRIAIVPLI